MNQFPLTIGAETRTVIIPDGYERVASGPVKKRDLAYDTAMDGFSMVKLDGNVIAEQCHLIIRKTQPRSFRATWEIPADQDISDLAEFHISRGRGDDDQDVGYFPSDVDARLTIHRGESTWFVELTVPTRGLEKEDDYWTSANQAFGQYDAEVELI